MKKFGLIVPLLVVVTSAPAFATSSVPRATSSGDDYRSVCNSRSATPVHEGPKPAKTPWESTVGVLSSVWDLMHGLETLRLANELPLGELQKISPSIFRFIDEASMERGLPRDLVDDFEMAQPSLKKNASPKISPKATPPSRFQGAPLAKPS